MEKVIARKPQLDRQDLWIAIAAFLIGLIVFWRTLAPDILLGDSGEFQVLAVTGGMAHATGYPIYLLIAKIFALLPIGSIAWRVDFLSAVMSSMALAFTYLIGRRLGVRRAFAVIGAVFLLLNPIFWWQSVIAEVYAISAAFFSAFLYCLLTWGALRTIKPLLIGGVLFGLCWGLHHTAVLALPAILAYLICTKAKGKEWGAAVGGGVLGFAIAMLGYFYIASINNQTTSINSIRESASAYNLTPEDFDSTWTRIQFTMWAREFAPQLSGSSPHAMDKSLDKYTDETIPDFGWPAIGLAVLGAGALLFSRRNWREGLLLFVSWLALVTFVLKYSAFDLEVDFILSHLIVAVFVAFGLQWLHSLATYKHPESMPMRWGTVAVGMAIIAIGMWGTIAGAYDAIVQGKPTFLKGDARELPYPIDTPTYPRDFASAVVSNLPDNAVVMTEWDKQWPINYMAQFEQHKPGITAIEMFPMGTNAVPATSMVRYLLETAKTRPMYSTQPHRTLVQYFDFTVVVPNALYKMTLR